MARRMCRWHQRNERGAFIVMWALLVVVLIVMVAIVVDLGRLRATNRNAQSVSDLAALAAGPYLAKRPADPVEACNAAVRYVRQNLTDFPAAASLPCSDLAQSNCVAGGTVAGAIPVDSGTSAAPYLLTIRYPLPTGDTDLGSQRSADGESCERMSVRLERTNKAFFAGVIGSDRLSTDAFAVVRGRSEVKGTDVAALLMLERERCGTIQTSGQGGILVKGFGTKPGIIHADSAGSVNPGGCTNNLNAGGYVVFGTKLPPAHPTRPGLPSIEALQAELPTVPADPSTIRAPILSLYALQAGNDAHAAAVLNASDPGYLGVRPDPEPAGRSGRVAVDERYTYLYNATPPQPGPIQLKRTAATTLSASMPPGNGGAPPTPWVRLTSIIGNGCSANGQTVTQDYVYIDCNLALTGNRNTLTFSGHHFVTKGTISIGSNTTVTFTNNPDLVVKGSTSNTPAIDIQGTLEINGGNSVPGSAPPCSDREEADDPAISPAIVTVLNGKITTGAQSKFKACQTTVYMAGLASPRPDNDNNTDAGFISIGGAGGVDWSAPNQDTRPACSEVTPPYPACYRPTDPEREFEDLAFWTESSALSAVGGQGNIFLTGIFFLPNAPFQFDGQAVQNIDRDAQFIARTLDMSGKGTLVLRPDPNNAVPLRTPKFNLIR